MTPRSPDAVRHAIRAAQQQIGTAYEELDALFRSMNDPRDFSLKIEVGDAADDLSNLLENLNAAEIEYNDEIAQSLLVQIKGMRASLDHLQKELQHITQVIGNIGTVVSVLQDAVSGLQNLATHLA